MKQRPESHGENPEAKACIRIDPTADAFVPSECPGIRSEIKNPERTDPRIGKKPGIRPEREIQGLNVLAPKLPQSRGIVEKRIAHV
mgnify:CR=1 FL=1